MKPIKKELLVTSQSLKFSQRPQTDAEGQAAVREFRIDAPAGYQQSGGAGAADQQGTIPALVQYHSTAGEMALGRRSACVGCAHWDNAQLRKLIALADGPDASATNRQVVEDMREILKRKGAGYITADGRVEGVDETLATSFGVCRVASDWVESVAGRVLGWPVVTQAEAACPPNGFVAGDKRLDTISPTKPLGFFVPKDLDSEKIGAKRYDEVLRAAQGKT